MSSFKLNSKHILLLLSNQIVQMCNDIYKFCSNGERVDVTDHAMAAACFAWVTLQAHTCMRGYLKDKIKHHTTINSTFVHFLTQHMTDQLAMGLKSGMSKIKGDLSTIKDQIRNRATMDSHNHWAAGS